MNYRVAQQIGFQGGAVAVNAPAPQPGVVISPQSKFPVNATCNNCHKTGMTRVESKIGNHGWIWAIVCYFCFSFLLSLLVLCIDAFKEFIHYCPSCNSRIAVYKPPFTGGVIALLILLPIGMFIISIVILVTSIIPLFYVAAKHVNTIQNDHYNSIYNNEGYFNN